MAIDFSQYLGDFPTQVEGLRLSQFGTTSPVLSGLLGVLTIQGIELNAAQIRQWEQLDVATASGINLDAIGRIVGQERLLLNASDFSYVTADDPALQPDSAAICSVTTAPLAGNVVANDEQYRQWIYAKIFKNHIQYGSIPEILYFVSIIYEINISILKWGNMDISLMVNEGTTEATVLTISSKSSDPNVQDDYFLPIQTTGRIISVITMPTGDDYGPFIWDQSNSDDDAFLCETSQGLI